jgi:predicted NBD/HSP70 family sugar kinase
LEAHYLALGVVNIITTLSPQRIIMGGGVMDQQQIFPMLRKEVQTLLNGYVQKAEILEHIDDSILCRPGWAIAPACWARSRWRWSCGGTEGGDNA